MCLESPGDKDIISMQQWNINPVHYYCQITLEKAQKILYEFDFYISDIIFSDFFLINIQLFLFYIHQSIFGASHLSHY